MAIHFFRTKGFEAFDIGFSANKRPNVRLYYGARNLQRMAYQKTQVLCSVDRNRCPRSFCNVEIVKILKEMH
ncbi:hypothetical protein Vadar_029507 [Vaccinium darrowii]|uniref:Uncharacterized protein n=1 Tax=Vaccinium darrowii TaxID=229202 RepID=A0ACB7Y458_9ERIC|nr:hypothetical protein Vadar_029507 [Vaccinium darrowii]